MKINIKTTKYRLLEVPVQCQVHIYDATRILLFLQENFEQPHKIIMIKDLAPYKDYDKDFFENPAHYQKFRIKATDLYDRYVEWYKTKTYTTAMESLYQFKMIIRRLRFPKNYWQFIKFRAVPSQTVYFTPLIPKGSLPIAIPDA